MGAIRRFSALDEDNSVFIFTIDTTLINPSGTDGSENPLTFQIPLSSSASGATNCIVRVSDGRPDIPMVGQGQVNSNSKLTFAAPGTYQIAMIGRVVGFNFYNASGVNYDRLKIVSVDNWGDARFNLTANLFRACINLQINAGNAVVLPVNSTGFFYDIKAINSPMELLNTSRVEAAGGMLFRITEPLKSQLNPFWSKLTFFEQIYNSSTFDATVHLVEIISDAITAIDHAFSNTEFRGRLVMRTPNLTTISRLVYNISNPPAVGGVDIRNVTNVTLLCNSLMNRENVDSTLLEWANGYDWSGISDIPNKCNINFFGDTNPCTCSDTPEVISAKTFLETKGYVFPHLTAV